MSKIWCRVSPDDNFSVEIINNMVMVIIPQIQVPQGLIISTATPVEICLDDFHHKDGCKNDGCAYFHPFGKRVFTNSQKIDVTITVYQYRLPEDYASRGDLWKTLRSDPFLTPPPRNVAIYEYGSGLNPNAAPFVPPSPPPPSPPPSPPPPLSMSSMLTHSIRARSRRISHRKSQQKRHEDLINNIRALMLAPITPVESWVVAKNTL